MGLVVFAYKNAKLAEDPTVSETDDLIYVYGGHFTKHLCKFQDGSYYEAECCESSYENGYSSHGTFREMLAELANYAPLITPKPDCSDKDFEQKYWMHKNPYSMAAWNAENGSFKELICFSDCEGVIGTEYCIKLSKDFKDFEEKALSMTGENSDWFLKKYQQLKSLFEYASHNGFVKFC